VKVTGGVLKWRSSRHRGDRRGGGKGIAACHDPADVQLHWIPLEASAEIYNRCKKSALESRRGSDSIRNITASPHGRHLQPRSRSTCAVRVRANDYLFPSAQHHAAAQVTAGFLRLPDAAGAAC